ncbi:nuclear receptor coactivator 5-like isoform X7 [Branchiostoma lanceolatum]|uniref:nuclear receptor coactivator 5-like isoform X7 n=1 Tax=Branchiostoma lanceolatum TaxID=7740 RepID=UPI00345450E5
MSKDGKREDSKERDRDDRDRRRPLVSSDTNDPRSINARVFIGNLPTDRMTRQELEDQFSKYGRITACSLHKGFGFVQFSDEQDARESVKGEVGKVIKGFKVDIKMAAEGRRERRPPGGGERGPDRGGPDRGGPDRGGPDRGGPERGGPDRDRDRRRSPPKARDPYGRGPPARRDRSPLRGDDYDERYREYYRSREGDPLLERRLQALKNANYDVLSEPQRREDPYADRRDPYARERYEEMYRRYDDLGKLAATAAPGRDAPEERREDPYRGRDDYEERLRAYERYYEEYAQERPLDCEIIVVQKAQRNYAEMVERRLRDLRLLTDLIFLNEQVTLAQALDDVSRRGVLYAVIVTSQHEMHRSVTLNILHGTPQEHRNMPLDDSMQLVARNFERYMQDLRERQAAERASSAGAPAAAAAENSATIPQLLNLLADGRQVTTDEIGRVIEYLQDRRSRLLQMQGGQSGAQPTPAAGAPGPTAPANLGGPPPAVPGVNQQHQQQAELQAKILSILNQDGNAQASQAGPNAQAAAAAAKAAAMASPAGGKPPSLMDLSVQPTGHLKGVPTPQQQAVNQYGMAQRAQPTLPPSSQATSTPSSLNFDNPTVQKALDSLIHSGPNLLKNLSQAGPQQTQTPSTNQTAAHMGQYGGGAQNVTGQYGSPQGMGQYGNPQGQQMGGGQHAMAGGNHQMMGGGMGRNPGGMGAHGQMMGGGMGNSLLGAGPGMPRGPGGPMGGGGMGGQRRY